MTLRSFRISAGCKFSPVDMACDARPSSTVHANFEHRLSPNQIQKLLNQYLVADYEQPINGEIMKAVASRVTEKSDVLLLQAVDMDDSGPYEIAEPRVITALETYTPSCESRSRQGTYPRGSFFDTNDWHNRAANPQA
jgi:hypothetical protein